MNSCIRRNRESRLNNETIIDSPILLDNFPGQMVMITPDSIYYSLPCYLCVRNKFNIKYFNAFNSHSFTDGINFVSTL